jgi:hypothetical protein
MTEDAPTPAPASEDAPETPPIPGQAPPGDTYSREQAAKVLGVSARRVSQLAGDGRLEVVQASPLRVAASSVHAERERRRRPDRDLRTTPPPLETAALISAEVAAVREILERAYARQIETGEALLSETRAERDRLLADLQAERDKADRERDRLLAEVAEEKARADAERERAEKIAAEKRRRWWQRKPAED